MPDTTTARPPSRELRQFVGDELKQICLWGSACIITDMWERLNMTCNGPAREAGVEKVDRIVQFNGAVRFDIYIQTEKALRVKRWMQVHNRRWNWHLREHIPFVERSLTPRAPQPAATPTAAVIRAPLRPGTLNINGVRTKQTDLWHLLRSNRLDVLALQETKLKVTDWDLRIPNYVCFSAMGHGGASERGVLLMVSKKFGCQPVGPALPHWVFVKLFGGALSGPIIVGSVYLPCHAGATLARQKLPQVLERIETDHPDCAILLMGDLNASYEQAQTLTRTWPGQFAVLPTVGEERTVRRANGRTVDHFCLFDNGLLPEDKPRPQSVVLKDWDISDHYPVISSLPSLLAQAQPQVNRPVGALKKERIGCPSRKEKESIIDSNPWEALADDAAEAGALLERDEQERRINSKSSALLACCHQVATTLKLHQKPPRIGPSCLPKPIAKIINQLRKAFR